jgi:hypothetical protein
LGGECVGGIVNTGGVCEDGVDDVTGVLKSVDIDFATGILIGNVGI